MPDLDTQQRIDELVECFYAGLLRDEQLAPIFIDVAQVDLQVHLPHIKRYWAKLLLGSSDYQRHTMNIHRQLNAKKLLTTDDFSRWLQLFLDSVDQSWAGPKAERAKRVAASIAGNMQVALKAG
ncbi:group III truncated hemoglobin [Halieaceae bacterium IMCC14734]|uniref:Group III truncated hemoglobin n=1 Tax=Candidatus Litorirhabdus singularis TaxID=2518993 RepID=A0ABT3TK42_9GAMM|nr:group III truncated hemoglobin [Candidatus Litorirhabdus singularis]MCX2981737.1 group III truncated hemoglobin [Candidatus Litorirhabdus singularis]